MKKSKTKKKVSKKKVSKKKVTKKELIEMAEEIADVWASEADTDTLEDYYREGQLKYLLEEVNEKNILKVYKLIQNRGVDY
jgi:hypothetical protein